MIIVFAGNGIWHSAVVLQYGSKDCPKRHSFHYPLEPPHNEMDDTIHLRRNGSSNQGLEVF